MLRLVDELNFVDSELTNKGPAHLFSFTPLSFFEYITK